MLTGEDCPLYKKGSTVFEGCPEKFMLVGRWLYPYEECTLTEEEKRSKK